MLRDEKYVRKSDFNIPGCNGMAPIHFATKFGTDSVVTEKVIEMMLDSMENPEQRDEFGNSVLHYATINEKLKVKVMKNIMGIGCELDAVNKMKRNALHFSVIHNNFERLKIILSTNINIKRKKISSKPGTLMTKIPS